MTPPLPPNGSVQQVLGDLCVEIADNAEEITFTCHRKVVAAVARCAWLDEAERLQDVHAEQGYVSALCPAAQQALAKAAAWKKWGQQ